MDERRKHVRQNILAHFDKAHFEGSMMYGVRWSDMDRDELAAVLCYVSKNPDIIKAMVPNDFKPRNRQST